MAAPRAKPGRSPASPPSESSHSGRLLLRMDPALHAELARTAERDGQSLNAYITGVLGEELGGRRRQHGATHTARRLVQAALVADLVLVAVAAALAIALLLIAWL